MKLQRIFPFFLLIGAILGGCSEENKSPDNPNDVIGPGENDKIGVSLDTGIKPYDGRIADDISRDKPSSNDSFYWEAGKYPVKVEIRYDGDRATVTSSNESVLIHSDGANVVVDGLSNFVSGIEIIASGHSDNGSLKIYVLARTRLL